MKIGYFADGPWSHKAIELLVGIVDVAFIVPRYDTQDPILREWAEKLGVPYKPEENVNSDTFVKWVKEQGADLLISMSFNQILKRDILDIAPLGFINCHAGALPFYRGRNPLNWVLINGETEFGITVHYIDEGIDTGDIIVQELFNISPEDDYSSLLELAISECANVLFKAVSQLKEGAIMRVKQSSISPIGTYFGRRMDGDEIIDFRWAATRVHNFVRAVTLPGPGARCWYRNQQIALLRCELIDGAITYIATEGEVVGVSSRGSILKVGDTTILVTSFSYIIDGEDMRPQVPNFKIGARLIGKQ
jgi:methionyl-tRNA formyltransferase